MQSSIPPRAAEAAHAGRLIDAIKIVRAETGLDLKDAKNAVEAFLKQYPAPPAARSAVQRGAEASPVKTVLLTLLVAGAAIALLLQLGLL